MIVNQESHPVDMGWTLCRKKHKKTKTHETNVLPMGYELDFGQPFICQNYWCAINILPNIADLFPEM